MKAKSARKSEPDSPPSSNHPWRRHAQRLPGKLALFTTLPAASVLEMLADLPAEEKEAAPDASAFLAAMEREGSTGVSSALGTAPANSPKEQRLAEIRRSRGAAQFGSGLHFADRGCGARIGREGNLTHG